MAWCPKTVILPLLLLLLLHLMVATSSRELKHQGILGEESVADLLPAVHRILQREPGAAACFLMRSPPKRCFQVLKTSNRKRVNNEEAESVNWAGLEDDAEEVDCSQGQGCQPSRLSEGRGGAGDSWGGGDESFVGPKRFYNNW